MWFTSSNIDLVACIIRSRSQPPRHRNHCLDHHLADKFVDVVVQ